MKQRGRGNMRERVAKGASPLDLVLVEWIDSCGHDGWVVSGELEKMGQELVQMRSVGWLLTRTKLTTTLVPHIGPEIDGGFMGRGAVAIPNVAISKIRKVSVSR